MGKILMIKKMLGVDEQKEGLKNHALIKNWWWSLFPEMNYFQCIGSMKREEHDVEVWRVNVFIFLVHIIVR